MPCSSPYYIYPTKASPEKVPVPCGRCPDCKVRRVNSWVFRLLQESKVSISSYFVTLTYATTNVPITDNGFMTLDKTHFQAFMKRLREYQCDQYKAFGVPKNERLTIKYYAVGEYGGSRMRPHYHAIIFNADPMYFAPAWGLGMIHVDQVNSNTIAYTLKYIDKPPAPKHERMDIAPEFSLMSKGLGANYLTQDVINYHRAELERNYVTLAGGYIKALPRYYRTRIWTEKERRRQARLIHEQVQSKELIAKQLHEQKYGPGSYDAHKDSERRGRYRAFYSQIKKRKEL